MKSHIYEVSAGRWAVRERTEPPRLPHGGSDTHFRHSCSLHPAAAGRGWQIASFLGELPHRTTFEIRLLFAGPRMGRRRAGRGEDARGRMPIPIMESAVR